MAVRDVVQAAAGVGGGGEYVEDVFSTYLYTGNSSTQTITNGIDLDGEGGLVWEKSRSVGSSHGWIDTVRGTSSALASNSSGAQNTVVAPNITAFNSNGYTINSGGDFNTNGDTYASWTFRKQPKFFDVVTWTGNGVAGRTVAHNLGSVPGCIIVKRTDGAGMWRVFHTSLGATKNLYLNDTSAALTQSDIWNDTAPTSTEFTVGDSGNVNGSGQTYVAYVFAHDAEGFGLTGTDNVISCGSFTTDGSGNATVSLGYEPQWVIEKAVSGTSPVGDWFITDNMRGWAVQGAYPSGIDNFLVANTAAADYAYQMGNPTATGYYAAAGAHEADTTYIYIAIRRGPMKTPESGTEVFAPVTYTGNGNTGRTISSLTSPVDLAIVSALNSQSPKLLFSDRLRGSGTGENYNSMRTLTSTSTVEESNSSLNGYYATLDYQDSVRLLGSSSGIYNGNGVGNLVYSFKRAPGFFDVVCYTGTGSATTVAHNLAAVPELMIVKSRSSGASWVVGSVHTGWSNYMTLQTTNESRAGPSVFNSTGPTTSVFTVGTASFTNDPAVTYAAYLFATCPGVSKVGSYTGTGTTLQIDCGFSAGARFILIKRTDSTGDWYVWDSARGIAAGNDPYLLLNSTAAEVTNTDYIDPLSSGFTVTSSAPAALNASGGSFIFFAIS